uniref:Unannotated protein n=1 Tax=freshwater metagenome TaxID=449393 RepID=A0A6J5ZR17_9ZZZZ
MLVLQPGGSGGLAAEALDELGVLGKAAVEQLDRNLAVQLQVGGAVDVGHPTRAEQVLDAVAAVDRRARFDRAGHRSSDSITAFAIGAASVPPKPPTVFSIVTAIATCGSAAGAKAMNQG